jgi:hypothetical protein
MSDQAVRDEVEDPPDEEWSQTPEALRQLRRARAWTPAPGD